MKKKEKSNICKYIIAILSLLVILIAVYIVVYLCFKGNGFFTTGIDLGKNDWLSFLGNYLSFSGTLIVSAIAIFQSRHYTQANKEESNKKRIKEIQPIFSIEITEKDTMIAGYAEAFPMYGQTPPLRHQNFTLKLENVGLHPVKHVIVFDKYLFQLLKCNSNQLIQIAYEDSPDCTHKSKALIRILQSDYERDENGLPKWFNINYEDIDGNDMSQIYELKNFDGTLYYSFAEASY